MKQKIIYIHGQGGTPKEAAHYQDLFKNSTVIGLEYKAQNPWEAKEEFPVLINKICENNESIILIANSIGAYFSMCALADVNIKKAYFISPIVDMEKLILDMMMWANITEEELENRSNIETDFGQKLSWEYLFYVRNNPINWTIPTHILYGEKDNLTSLATIKEFANRVGATLTIMEAGEHWFHTPEQMEFLDSWITQY